MCKNEVTPKVEIGDIVFIRIDNFLYRRVASTTKSWTSHVGVVVDNTPGKELVAESAIPFSRTGSLSNFIKRSKNGMFSIKRYQKGLTCEEKSKIKEAATKRLGIAYHTGFKFDSKRQFCSKFVYQVFHEAIGVEIGRIENFGDLLKHNKNASKCFWRIWFFGFIPWERKTVTPASQYESSKLVIVFEDLKLQML